MLLHMDVCAMVMCAKAWSKTHLLYEYSSIVPILERLEVNIVSSVICERIHSRVLVQVVGPPNGGHPPAGDLI
jgi:hypothetical protein